MNVLLLGRHGQIGWELQRALAPLGNLTALGRAEDNGLSGDLENPDELSRTVREIAPDVIVNAAAYTDVDGAETDAERAERVNAGGPALLAAEAARSNALLVHYSTDYVFDGRDPTPRREGDPPAPLNVYGATKWRGEQAVRDSGCRHLIFRTQWIYAARGENFLRNILQLATTRDELRVVADQSGAPTSAELVADVTAHALRLAKPDRSGTYHVVARGTTTWHEYACFAIREARRAGRPIRVADTAITAVTAQDFAAAARRPGHCALAVDRLEQAFGLRMPDWRVGVTRVIAECP
jgi:dTDP-4-dehydrorhamnose reductase